MAERTFRALQQQAGWVAKTGAYDELFATITDQAIAPMLDAFGDIAKKRLLDVACGIENETTRRQIVDRIPLGQIREPRDVAAPVVFLCAPGASFVTGPILYVDGGITATQ